MTYALTIFKNQYDNKTHRRLDFDTWDQFSKFLYKLSERPLKGKRDAELISPAVYKAGTTRSNKNVLAWQSWAAIDVDDITFEGELEDELRQRYGSFNYVCYSTASSSDLVPKFRLVFPLVSPVEAAKIKHFWFALNTETEAIGDRQTKDLSRMYFVPACYSGANNFIFSNTSGVDIDPDLLMAKHEYSEKLNSTNFLDRLPEAWKEQVIEHRKGKLSNTDYTWTGYSDCPFWPKKLAAEYMSISGEGWYRKMYAIMIGIAGNAVYRGYPITAKQIVDLCLEFDRGTGNWYENRPMEVEANNALHYVYSNNVIGENNVG